MVGWLGVCEPINVILYWTKVTWPTVFNLMCVHVCGVVIPNNIHLSFYPSQWKSFCSVWFLFCFICISGLVLSSASFAVRAFVVNLDHSLYHCVEDPGVNVFIPVCPSN